MASVIEDAAKECAKTFIIDSIKECYSYIRDYNDNIKQLKEKYNDLASHNEVISNKAEHRNEENLHKTTKLANDWFARVQRLIEEDELKQIIDEKMRKGKDKCCFRRINCNLYQRYEMSKMAEAKVKEIEALIQNEPEESMITEPRSDLKSIPNEFLTNLDSRVQLMEDVFDKLRDDHVVAVGLFGMGAIGKTTLAKEIANKAAKEKFEITVMVEISEAPNVERIQDQISEQLGLKLDNVRSAMLRAKKLYNRLRNSKILVILDNLWEKLDLDKVGIPQPYNSKQFCCKLLVTSRKKNVCEAMGVFVGNILEVNPLKEEEARKLFRARVVGVITNDVRKEQEEVVKRMLRKCGGLPLAIVALADVLKNQELSTWEHFATELEKPVSKSQAKISRQTYSILETSYKLMESEEKKRFFLLACLFPYGASIAVEEMVRYSIGIGLFQHVDNVVEAMDLANAWVDELISSALLLEDDRKGHAKIHDVVRASTISFAEKGGDMFMVEAFPRWLLSETYQKYYAISLMPGSDHSRLKGLNSNKLQILILDNTKPHNHFPDDFFEGMTNLKVLVLKGMDFMQGLPKSIVKLRSTLRTLHMEECSLWCIQEIGVLTNLLVLSFRGSSMFEVPTTMENLCNLRLLDLNNCSITRNGVPAEVLSMMSQLEGLYAFAGGESLVFSWPCYNNGIQETSGNAQIVELDKLTYLKVVELRVKSKDWPVYVDLQFVRNLDHFHISIGMEVLVFSPISSNKQFSRVLQLEEINVSSFVNYRFLTDLLVKTEKLNLSRMKELEYIFNDSDQYVIEDEFPSLEAMEVKYCDKMQSMSCAPFSAPNFTDISVLG